MKLMKVMKLSQTFETTKPENWPGHEKQTTEQILWIYFAFLFSIPFYCYF